VSNVHDDAASILEDASGLIQINGWRQWNFGKCGEPMCTVGAVAESAKSHTGRASAAHLLAIRTLRRVLGVDHVWAWNDKPARTEDEVHDALISAAKELRNGNLEEL
jgi:hypothetical protein